MDSEAFRSALLQVRLKHPREGIGRLGEKTLHAVLKYYLEPDDSRHEIKLGRYYADIVNQDGVIEIQTRNFNTLRAKLTAFLEYAPVTVVYPVPQTKYLVWIDRENGAMTKRRKSPKTGTVYDVFFELYKIKPFLKQENFRLKVILCDLVEYRNLDGWSDDRKKGSSRFERIPKSITGERDFTCPGDYKSLIPDTLPNEFSSADFADAVKISRKAAQTALNILMFVGVAERAGRNKNGYLYRKAPGKIPGKNET